jgi:hypothetical protein
LGIHRGAAPDEAAGHHQGASRGGLNPVEPTTQARQVGLVMNSY